MNAKPKIIAIVGPTASGKTDLALALARKFNGELVAADSRTVYKGMDIGTAKPKGVKTYLINLVTPDQLYSVADFQKDAQKVISKILKAGKLPIIVGGTGFYVQALLQNYSLPSSDPNIRRKLEKQDLASLVKQLKKLDPKTQVDLQNPRRVVRALEICLITGQPFSQIQTKGEAHYDSLVLGLQLPRPKLYKRIDQRVHKMIEDGLEKEVRKLSKKYDWSAPGMNGLGYRQFQNYFAGKATLEETVQEIQKQTRHYAKRQETWFKKMPDIKWIKTEKQAEKLIAKFVE